jgi:hypothetical protein
MSITSPLFAFICEEKQREKSKEKRKKDRRSRSCKIIPSTVREGHMKKNSLYVCGWVCMWQG